MDFAMLELLSRRALQNGALTELELVVAHKAIDYSYALGVRVARFKRFKFFCAVCGHGKNKISPALSRVEAYEIVRVNRRDGVWTIEFCADPAQWRVPKRIRPAQRGQAAQVDAWLKQINAPGMEEQPELWPDEPTLDDALFEVYRESALGRSDPRVAAQSEPDWQDAGLIDRLTRQSLAESEQSEAGAVVPQKGTGGNGGENAVVSLVVPQKGTPPIAIGRAESSPVTGTGTGNGPAKADFLNEQLDRLERTIGEERVKTYLPWWRKHAGESHAHTEALRKTLDAYSDNRGVVNSPDRWIVKTFKNKIRAIGKALHLL
jgi:hypothetical protein